MKIHPLMLAAAIAFWGWQTDYWPVAALAGAALCASFFVPLRWALSQNHLYRIADFCIVLALLLGGFFYVSVGNPRVIVLFFLWLPVIFLPLALAHAYGTAERMELAVLFWRLRRGQPARPLAFDPWFAYFAMWIVAAAAANVRGEWFYVGLVALIAWPLLLHRPRTYRLGTWGLALLLAVGLGYGLQYNLHVAQLWLEEAVPEWITNGGALTDPYRSATNMGHIGKLKESDAIVLRVVPAVGERPPDLLHAASFDVYFDATWMARSAGFVRVPGGTNNRWPLAAAKAPLSRIKIYDYTARLNPVLNLPGGTAAIEGLKALNTERNRLGTVQVQRLPGFFSYVAAYVGGEPLEGAPTEADLTLPTKEREAFDGVATKLGLKAQPEAAKVARVMAFFADGFEYSTYLEEAQTGGSPVVNFLLHSKSGHCEYFATATVLLLRAGGVPARYATGFAIREKSELEDAYIARQRHRHAWVHAYVNGAWVEVDTTPPSWMAVEAKHGGAFSKLWDLWSWLRFRAAQAWATSERGEVMIFALLLLSPVVAWLAWRLYRSRNPARARAPKTSSSTAPSLGADSEYYRIEQQLSAQGWGRRSYDTAQDWLARLASEARMDTRALAEIVDLHARYRFDPNGLSARQRVGLREAAEQWLASNVRRGKG